MYLWSRIFMVSLNKNRKRIMIRVMVSNLKRIAEWTLYHLEPQIKNRLFNKSDNKYGLIFTLKIEECLIMVLKQFLKLN
jgi:hypothetical protein